MKEFIYLLNKEGVLLIVESAEEMPKLGEQVTEEFFKTKFKAWFTASNKYPCADKGNEEKFIDFIKKWKGYGNSGLLQIERTLTAGIRINKENVKIECINCGMSLENHVIYTGCQKTRKPNYVAYFVSPPLVIGGEETQESIWRELVDAIYVLENEGNPDKINILKYKFHITRINQ